MNLKLIFISFVDPTGESGQNLYSRAIINALASHENVSLHVVCPIPEKSIPKELAYKCSSFTYLIKKEKRSVRWHVQVQYSLFQSLREFDSSDIDGIVTSLKPASLAVPLICTKLSVPMVLLVEGLTSRNMKKIYPIPGINFVGNTIAIMNASRSRHTFTAYHEAKEWIQSLPFVSEESVSVFNHGVDTDIFKPTTRSDARKQLGYNISQEFVIGYVGSFKPYHCLDALLDTANHMIKQGKEVHLFLVGDGPEFEHIKNRSKRLGIDSYITFTGFVDQSMVPTYVSTCDATWGVVDPNHWGSPMKVFEYLSCARPVIAYESSELEFIEEISAGYLISEISTDEIVHKISKLMDVGEDCLQEMGNKGREYIEAEHNWSTLADQIVQEFIGVETTNDV